MPLLKGLPVGCTIFSRFKSLLSIPHVLLVSSFFVDPPCFLGVSEVGYIGASIFFLFKTLHIRLLYMHPQQKQTFSHKEETSSVHPRRSSRDLRQFGSWIFLWNISGSLAATLHQVLGGFPDVNSRFGIIFGRSALVIVSPEIIFVMHGMTDIVW